MNLNSSKHEVVQSVRRMREKLSIEVSAPLDIDSAVAAVDRIVVRTQRFETPGLRGISFLAEAKDEPHIILLNSLRSRRERRFDLAHELYHISYHGKFNCVFQCVEKEGRSLGRIPILEYQANSGAAELLMPAEVVIPFAAENRDCFGSDAGLCYLTEQVAKRCDVTLVSAELRIYDLLYETYCYLSGCPLEQIIFLSRHALLQRGWYIPPQKLARSVLSPDDPRIVAYHFPEGQQHWRPAKYWQYEPRRKAPSDPRTIRSVKFHKE